MRSNGELVAGYVACVAAIKVQKNIVDTDQPALRL